MCMWPSGPLDMADAAHAIPHWQPMLAVNGDLANKDKMRSHTIDPPRAHADTHADTKADVYV